MRGKTRECENKGERGKSARNPLRPPPGSLPGPCLAALFLLCAPALFAGGAREQAPPPRNGEWAFCVTAFDASAMPRSRRLLGDLLANSLVQSLGRVEYRIRPAPEYAWYEEAARIRDLGEAGRLLSAKHEERSRLVFQGYPEWRYRRDLRSLDREIAVLEAAYSRLESQTPPVAQQPVFRLSQENSDGFPAPPPEGGEFSWCASKNADAFLSGAVSEYYGRIFIRVRVYARYARAWIFEDATVFSPEDISAAMDELAGRVVSAIRGVPPAAVRVVTEPADAMIMLRGRYAGRSITDAAPGGGAEARNASPARAEGRVIETAPGPAEIAAFADFHLPRTFTEDLEGGFLYDVNISLTPLGRTLIAVRDTPGITGQAGDAGDVSASVYLGALYLGRAPVTVELAAGSAGYFRVEGPDGLFNTTVIPAGLSEGTYGVSLPFRLPLPQGRTENARRSFYGAWGRFWLALPLCVLINGLGMTAINAYNVNPARSQMQLESAQTWYFAAIASDVILALFAGESIIRAINYASVSSRGEPVQERTF